MKNSQHDFSNDPVYQALAPKMTEGQLVFLKAFGKNLNAQDKDRPSPAAYLHIANGTERQFPNNPDFIAVRTRLEELMQKK